MGVLGFFKLFDKTLPPDGQGIANSQVGVVVGPEVLSYYLQMFKVDMNSDILLQLQPYFFYRTFI